MGEVALQRVTDVLLLDLFLGSLESRRAVCRFRTQEEEGEERSETRSGKGAAKEGRKRGEGETLHDVSIDEVLDVRSVLQFSFEPCWRAEGVVSFEK